MYRVNDPHRKELVHRVLDENAIVPYFQPVVNISSRTILGFEALSRGVLSDGTTLEADLLYAQDNDPEMLLEMNRLSLEKALHAFSHIHATRSNLLLFLNMDASTLALVENEYGFLERLAARIGFSAERLIIELAAHKLRARGVQGFIEYYRSRGFSFSLDAIDRETNVLDVLLAVSPMYLKLGRTFILDPATGDYCRPTISAIASLAQAHGCALIGLGVERLSESLSLLHCGVGLQQGFYFSRQNDSPQDTDPVAFFKQRVEDTYTRFREASRAAITLRKERFVQYATTNRRAAYNLVKHPETHFEAALTRLSRLYQGLVSAFVLDAQGRQITPRVTGDGIPKPWNPADIPRLVKGADHSLQDYFLHLDTGYERFVTEPFISPYTRDKSCLMAQVFFNTENRKFILCLEMTYP